jgi:hypothetical protein
MKSFKSYLTEAQKIYNTKDFIFGWNEMPALVLSTTALERVFGGLARIKGWHVTNLPGVQGLKKIQGKKNSISVMRQINPKDNRALSGIDTKGGFVVELEGIELLSADKDVFTTRLESGRRGIRISKENFPSMFRHMVFVVKNMYEKYSKKPQSKNSTQAAMELNGLGQTLSQKEKGQFIKEYIDNCEDILMKNKTAQQELRKYGRSKDRDSSSGYNESVINQISIKNVYVMMEQWDEWASSEFGAGKYAGDYEQQYEDEEKLLQKTVWKNIEITGIDDMIKRINKK